MGSDTRQLIEVLVALSPYVIFIGMIVWSAAAELAEERSARKARQPPPAD